MKQATKKEKKIVTLSLRKKIERNLPEAWQSFRKRSSAVQNCGGKNDLKEKMKRTETLPR